MNIIIIPVQGAYRTLRLSRAMVASFWVVFFLVMAVASIGVMAIYQKIYYGKDLTSTSIGATSLRNYVSDNFASMSDRIGRMQTQILKLDALSQQLGRALGVKPSDVPAPAGNSQGGPRVSIAQDVVKNADAYLDALDRNLEQQGDYLTMLKHWQQQKQLKKSLTPSLIPIEDAPLTSGFGYRMDPFTRENTMHEGIDLAAPVGTSVRSSAAGIVVFAAYHPEYGNMIDIEHDGGITTRYAHLSKLKVKAGQIVKPGEIIGQVGMTGRTNGPHLHFEVRALGVARNPVAYLR